MSVDMGMPVTKQGNVEETSTLCVCRDLPPQRSPSGTASERKLSFAYKRFGFGLTVHAE